jgi:hypothetical protein
VLVPDSDKRFQPSLIFEEKARSLPKVLYFVRLQPQWKISKMAPKANNLTYFSLASMKKSFTRFTPRACIIILFTV